MKRLFALILVFLFFNTLSCQKNNKDFNIILITIDTLRADHLSCYGYSRNTSPNIDKIAKQGVLFEDVTASSSFTPPSMATIFTAQNPSFHGVKHGIFKKGKVFNQEVLHNSIVTLAEVLKKNGYATFGFYTNPHLSREFGFAQGFDLFDQFSFVDALELNTEIMRYKDRIESKGKYFLWVHYFDPHWPYFKKQPWINKYSTYKNEDKRESEYKIAPEKFSEIKGLGKNQALLSYITARYDSEINFVDRYVGELLQFFKADKDALVIITSDHGEEFFEHNEFTHGLQLYEETIKVPLIIYSPSRIPSGLRIKEQAGIIDVMPTILDFLGIKELKRNFFAESLIPLISKNKKEGRILYSELARVGRNLMSAESGKWKYIYNIKEKKEELYDLNTDPFEKNNIVSENSEVAQNFKIKLDSIILSGGKLKSQEKAVNTDVVNSLKSLGYIN